MSHSRDKGKNSDHAKKKPHLSIKEKRKLKKEKHTERPVIPVKE